MLGCWVLGRLIRYDASGELLEVMGAGKWP
jgi:hypothetical protein